MLPVAVVIVLKTALGASVLGRYGWQRDELYYVVRGKARMRAGAVDRPIAEGSVIFVGANVEHKFHDIEAALTVLVFFAPAEVES